MKSQNSQDPFNPDFDACAPSRGFGHIDHVNSLSSIRKATEISRFEARLIVEHWLGELDRFYAYRKLGVWGSIEMRTEPYAFSRISAMIETGLVTEDEVTAFERKIRQRPPRSAALCHNLIQRAGSSGNPADQREIRQPATQRRAAQSTTSDGTTSEAPALIDHGTCSVPLINPYCDEVSTWVNIGAEHSDLAANGPWYEEYDEESPQEYTVLDLLGTKIHVYLEHVLRARHLGVPIVTGGIRPGGRCPEDRRETD